MASIHKLTKDGQTIYPATTTDAVVHPDLAVSSSKLIEEVNVSKIFPTGGIDGTNKYTLETAIAMIPSSLRNVGLKCSFLDEEGELETWEYKSGTFTSTSCWIQGGAAKISELNQETCAVKGKMEITIQDYDSNIGENKGISNIGEIVTSNGCSIYKINVKGFNQINYKHFKTGGAANRNSGFFKIENGKYSIVQTIIEDNTDNAMVTMDIPEDAEYFLSTVITSSDYNYTAILYSDKSVEGLLGTIGNISSNVNKTENYTYNSIEKKTLEAFSWEDILAKKEYIGIPANCIFSIEDTNDKEIGKVFKLENNTAGQVYVNANTLFYIILPWSSELNISVWKGSNIDEANTFFPGFTIIGTATSTAATQFVNLYFLVCDAINYNNFDTIKETIDAGGVYNVTTSITKHATLTDINVATNFKVAIDAYKYVGNVLYFHFNISATNVYKVNAFAFSFVSNTFALKSNKYFTIGALSLDNNKRHFNIEADNKIISSAEINLSNNSVDEEDNLISDQFDGFGNMFSFNSNFELISNNQSRQARLVTNYKIKREVKDISIKGLPDKLKMVGYTFYDEEGADLTKYESGTKEDPIFEIQPPYYVNDSNTFEEVDDYTFQFWLNLDELNGCILTRCHNNQLIRFNIQLAQKGNVFTLANYSNPAEWESVPIDIEIVEKVGNMICIRCPHLKELACKWSLIPKSVFTFYTFADNPLKSLTIYNPVLLKGDCYPSPWKRYLSRSEKDGLGLRGKNVLLIGDSEYNNGILGNTLVRKYGVNFYDMHYGGHRLSIGPNYSTNTGVNSISHSWFYQETYRKLVLSIKNIDYYILTMSSNDSYGDSDWSGSIDESLITTVENNYPTISDILNEDNSSYNTKIALFNGMNDSQKNDAFGYVGTYCAYIKQMLEVNPYARLYLCTVPISCAGYLTGTSVPNPDGVSEDIGEWAEDESPDTARAGLEEGYLRKDEQIRAISKRYHAHLVDIRSKCGLTYENFIYHCADGVHWHKDIAHNCAQIIAKALTR